MFGEDIDEIEQRHLVPERRVEYFLGECAPKMLWDQADHPGIVVSPDSAAVYGGDILRVAQRQSLPLANRLLGTRNHFENGISQRSCPRQSQGLEIQPAQSIQKVLQFAKIPHHFAETAIEALMKRVAPP